MLKKLTLTEKTASILLALVISARATSFMFSKLCLATMSPADLLGIRFLTAALLMFLIFFKQLRFYSNRTNIINGCIFGICYFACMQCELNGLVTTNSSTASFLENMAIVIVPFMEAIICTKLPNKKDLLRAFAAFAGVGLLTMKDSGIAFSSGEILLLGSAFFYAVAICVTNRLSRQGDAFTMGFYQVLTIGTLSTLFSIATNQFAMPETSSQWSMILMLAIVCTGFGFTLQPVAQSKVSAEKAGLYCALSPVIAAVLGAVFMGEIFTPLGIVGSLMILAALAIH